MSTLEWPHDDVLQFCKVGSVYLRNPDAEPLPLPGWLLDAGVDVGTIPTGDRFAAIHPDDRGCMADAFFDAVKEPGVVKDVSYRTSIGGSWHRERLRYVNLVGLADVAGILGVVETLEPLADIEIEGIPQVFEGEWVTNNWMFEVLDEKANIVTLEGTVEEMIGVPPAQLVGASITQMLHPDSLPTATAMWLDLVAHPGSTRSARLQLQRPDGRLIWTESALVSRSKDDGSTEIFSFVHDITEKREQEQAMQQLAGEFQLLADQVPSAAFRADASGRITFHNARWLALIGGDEGVTHLQHVFAPEHRSRIEHELRSLTEPGADLHPVDLELTDRTGAVLAVNFRAVGEAGSPRQSFVGSVEDITATVRLREQANTDPLTGLLNRRGIEDHLHAMLIGHPGGALVVFLDLDGFKSVNDTHGHDIGDHVLATMAQRLLRGLRADDAVGRYGGDEFVLVCRAVGSTDENAIVDRVDAVLGEPVTWPGGVWSPMGSIGWARPEVGEELASVIRRADHAMLAVKRERHLRNA